MKKTNYLRVLFGATIPLSQIERCEYSEKIERKRKKPAVQTNKKEVIIRNSQKYVSNVNKLIFFIITKPNTKIRLSDLFESSCVGLPNWLLVERSRIFNLLLIFFFRSKNCSMFVVSWKIRKEKRF